MQKDDVCVTSGKIQSWINMISDLYGNIKCGQELEAGFKLCLVHQSMKDFHAELKNKEEENPSCKK